MSNVPAFEQAGKEILGEYGCLPMVAFGTNKTLSAFKLLSRARNLDFDLSNSISKQIKDYEMDLKHAKENNEDDPDYDPDEDVKITDYVSSEYLPLIEDSRQYLGIITSLAPHPCAHILLDRDVRKEIGIIRVKSKSGSKEPVFAAYIDGVTADTYGYLKADYLRVDVVNMIYQGYKAAGIPLPPVDELLELVRNDEAVWDLYRNGYTICLNQCEKEKTTQRIMRYQPQNVVELAAFVAAVRPGFKSMLETYVSRTRFCYGIDSLDRILATKEIPDSFLMYDEQILSILQSAGIPPSDAYACIKAIKKKKADKVKAYETRFREGFVKHLIQDEGVTDVAANETVDKIWTIINDAASYLFCAAHAFSMACDNLYCAYLKAHYPYEFYATILSLYDDKGKKEKIAQIAQEMARYQSISLRPGAFYEDNRNWYINKEDKTISQSLSSIKFMPKSASESLYLAGQKQFSTFTDLLYYLQSETHLDTRQLEILISINYFKSFGECGKLYHVFKAFTCGDEAAGVKRITKTLTEKTVSARLESLRSYEASLPNNRLHPVYRLRCEYDNIGMCFTKEPAFKQGGYYVCELDTGFGVKATVYNIQNGLSGQVRIKREVYNAIPFEPGDMLYHVFTRQKPSYHMINGNMVADHTKKDYWLDSYSVQKFQLPKKNSKENSKQESS